MPFKMLKNNKCTDYESATYKQNTDFSHSRWTAYMIPR